MKTLKDAERNESERTWNLDETNTMTEEEAKALEEWFNGKPL